MICPICKAKNHSYFNDLCENCKSKLQFFGKDSCYSCGGDLDGALAICSKCIRERKRSFIAATSVLPYQDFNRELIISFKSNNKPELAHFLAQIATKKLIAQNWEFDLVTVVPLHWSRLFKRKFNQSALLGELIAKNVQKSLKIKAIKRVKKGLVQKQLNSAERHKNLKNAFQANSKLVKGKRILLVDDVFTTGATLDNASIALKKAGATAVFVLTIARA